jgi:hypothetical protein
MTTYEQIAREFTDEDTPAQRLWFIDAVAAAEANTVAPVMACPGCHNNQADRLVIHEDAVTWVECLICLDVYEVRRTAPVVEVDEVELWRQDQRDTLADIQR